MVVGVAVSAGLILLLALSEKASGFLWHDGTPPTRHPCPTCDLTYDDDEVVHGVLLTCPRGHPVSDLQVGFSWTTALAVASVTVIGGCLAALAGVVPA